MLPLLNRTWCLFRKRQLHEFDAVLVNEFLEACLSSTASKWRFDSVHRLRELADYVEESTPKHLQQLLLLRLSLALRSGGLHAESSELLKAKCIDSVKSAQNSTERYFGGRLCLSQAENCIHAEEFRDACSYMSQCSEILEELRSGNKEMHIHLSRMHATASGRLWRYMGRFETSLDCLQLANDAPDMSQPQSLMQRCHIIHHMSDVLCELGQLSLARDSLRRILTEVDWSKKTETAAYRRLMTSLTEVEIRSGDLTAAEKILSWLRDNFQKTLATDPADQIGHVYTEIKSAIVAYRKKDTEYLRTVERHLLEALSLIGKYGTFPKGSFYDEFVRRFLELVSGRTRVTSAVETRHFMAGLGTHDYDFIKNEEARQISEANRAT